MSCHDNVIIVEVWSVLKVVIDDNEYIVSAWNYLNNKQTDRFADDDYSFDDNHKNFIVYDKVR